MVIAAHHFANQRVTLGQSHGEGFRILTGASTSPTLAPPDRGLKRLYPEMEWHRWEPVSRDAVRAGAMLAYGQPVEIVPHLDAVDVLVTIDSDLLDSAPGHLRFARDFAARRNPVRSPVMSRDLCDRANANPDRRRVRTTASSPARDDIARIVPALAAAVTRNETPAGMPAMVHAAGRRPARRPRPRLRPCRPRAAAGNPRPDPRDQRGPWRPQHHL